MISFKVVFFWDNKSLHSELPPKHTCRSFSERIPNCCFFTFVQIKRGLLATYLIFGRKKLRWARLKFSMKDFQGHWTNVKQYWINVSSWPSFWMYDLTFKALGQNRLEILLNTLYFTFHWRYLLVFLQVQRLYKWNYSIYLYILCTCMKVRWNHQLKRNVIFRWRF